MIGLPEGFVYRPEFVSAAEEAELSGELGRLEFRSFQMHGVTARRRVLHYGWLYGYDSWRLDPGPPAPEFLLPYQARAAEWVNVKPEDLAEVLVTQYPP